jgi:ABC-type multidrug transport system ATPase subunit
MNHVIIRHISKTYKGTEALREISLDIRPGELFGLTGPDGAGKTTLFRILATLLLPDSGSATVCGLDTVRDFRQIRRRVGYMPGRFSLYQDLSVEENLRFFASVFGTSVKENYALIRDIYVHLEPFRRRRAGQLSGGMKQKLALCCALIHRPGVLLLDEPTTGVDPVSRLEFWDMLERLRQQGITILVSTPYMDEAARCGRIALMHSGRCLSVDTPQAICRAFGQRLYAVRSDRMYALLNDLRNYEETVSCYAFGDSHHLVLPPGDGAAAAAGLAGYLRGKGHTSAHIEPIAPGVEDCFMALEKEASCM